MILVIPEATTTVVELPVELPDNWFMGNVTWPMNHMSYGPYDMMTRLNLI